MTPTLEFFKQELHWDGGSCYLRKGERTVLVGLARPACRARSYDELIGIAYPDPDHEPEDAKGTLDVTLHRLNKKIAPSGLRVIGHHGWGQHVNHDFSIDWRHA